MKLLIITYHYHPENNPRAYRWTNICENLSKKYDIDLYTKNGFSILKNHDLNKFFEKIPSKNNIIYRFLRFFRWPDYAFLWLLKFITKDLLKKKYQDYEKIIAVSHPFSSHLIGILISKLYKIPLELDVGDPFSFNSETPLNNYLIYNKVNHKIEKFSYNFSRKIYVTNPNMRNYIKNNFGIDDEKISIAWPVGKIFDKHQEMKINIVHNINYYGTLYENQRTMEDIIDAIKILDGIYIDFNVNIFGDNDNYFKNFTKNIPCNVKIHQTLSAVDYGDSLCSAEAVINIGNNNINQIPSKLADYILNNKKIFNFIKYINDPSVIYSANYFNITNYLLPHGIEVKANESNNLIFDSNYNQYISSLYE